MTRIIKTILILLIIFTPAAFGSLEIWAFSIMELGILLIIILWTLQSIFLLKRTSPGRSSSFSALSFELSPISSSELRTPNSTLLFMVFFLLLILFQLLPLPPGVLKALSPKAFELRSILSTSDLQSTIPGPWSAKHTPLGIPSINPRAKDCNQQLTITNQQSLSFLPFKLLL